jgi:hypothetical protein
MSRVRYKRVRTKAPALDYARPARFYFEDAIVPFDPAFAYKRLRL